MGYLEYEELKRIRENQERENFERWQERNPWEAEQLKKENEISIEGMLAQGQRDKEEIARGFGDATLWTAVSVLVLFIGLASPVGLFYLLVFAGLSLLLLCALRVAYAKGVRRHQEEQALVQQEKLQAQKENHSMRLKEILPLLTDEDLFYLLGISDAALLNTYRLNAPLLSGAQTKTASSPNSNHMKPSTTRQLSAGVTSVWPLSQRSGLLIAKLLTDAQRQAALHRYEYFKSIFKQFYYDGIIKQQSSYFEIIEPTRQRMLRAGFESHEVSGW